MPFGSPMTDVSDSSSTSSPPLKQRVRQKLQANSPAKGQASASAGPRSRPTAPQLNLVTNFTRPRISQASGQGHRRQESIQERRRNARVEGSKGRVETIKSADSRLSGLSPSDRDLVIGIALQPENVNAQRGGVVTQHAGNHQGITPEIVITPAALENPWNLADNKSRPRSSVYSQATQHARGVSQFGSIPLALHVPPVPPIPSNALVPLHKAVRPVSAASWHTDFSEDEDRDVLFKRYSNESQLGILRTKSVDTIATRHRSKGWWNTLLSPLLDRSSTIIGRKSIKVPKEKASDTPNRSKPEMASSPIVEKSDEKSEVRGSLRSDITPWEENRHTLAFFTDSPTDLKRQPDLNRGKIGLSLEFIPEKGFGEAAEYFEACWHDIYSPTPYFKCQNHSCRRLWYYRHGPAIGGPDAAHEAEQRSLAHAYQPGGMAKNHATDTEGGPRMAISPVEVSKAPDGDWTQTHSSPTSPHIRKLSDSTSIDEADVTSEIQNARSQASSNYVCPVPEATETARGEPPTFEAEILPLEPVAEDTRELNPSNATQLQPAPVKAQVATLELPRASPPSETAAPSPPALTPGLQREFVNHNAIPMEPTPAFGHATTSPPSTTPPSRDLLQIEEPRAAPQPPEARYLEPAPTASTKPSAFDWSPLSDHPVGTRNGLGIGPYRRSPDKPLPASAINHDHETPHGYSLERSVSGERSHAPAFEHPPWAWPVKEDKKSITASVKEVQGNGSKDRAAKWKLTSCIPKAKTKDGKRKRKICLLIFGALFAMVLLILVLVLTLTIPRSDIPIQDSWLNISGFPPIPTGIATIAQPNAAVEDSQCVAPTTMWSCAVPKEQQQSIAPNQPDQPNFRIEIRFQNGSAAISSSNSTPSRRSLQPADPVSAGQFVRYQLLRARDSFTSSLFIPNPAPPSEEDQNFLGNTTDNNTAPFAGEATPFFVSFLPTTPVSSAKFIRRQDPSLGTNATNPFPNISIAIPPPSVNSDGTAAAANLYPFPSAQPLQLYNRGRSDEHYGFYTYFDRSIFLRSQDLLNSTSEPNVPGDEDGGSLESAANVRCTWTQTRFLVQIWTNAGNAVQLLSNSNSTTNSSTGTTTTSALNPSSTQDSADDLTRPGSFPYPVSITLDRHGGDIATKMIYCYGMDDNERIISGEKQIHIENRAAGGPGLINAAEGIFGHVNVSTADGGPGGIDGGVGGCRCLWQNWAAS